MSKQNDVLYVYNGNVSKDLFAKAMRCFNIYKSDKEKLVQRIKDDERFYRRSYQALSSTLNKKMTCNTNFIFSSIENARADAIENYPTANILEREEGGGDIADKLSKIIPVQLEISEFEKAYSINTRNKLKYGTAIYGVFYNDKTDDIDIKALDIQDVYVDMHISDIQESQFLFIVASIENDILKENYPEYSELFNGDTTIKTNIADYTLYDRTEVIDCYYKKSDGTLHLMKICKNNIIEATEDMDGYENGLYNHGSYPVVFDVLYPEEHCPFGFGMIDIGKSTQVAIDKLDASITENIIKNNKVRYFAKEASGIDEKAFKDAEKEVVHIQSESGIQAIPTTHVSEYSLTHREYKKDELKELLANRDFQQGSTSGGVTSGSAIVALQQAGEKRSRSSQHDSYNCFKDIVKMVIELIRQFYNEPRKFRNTDEMGHKEFTSFSSDEMYVQAGFHSEYDELNDIDYDVPVYVPIEFDIDVVPQKENPYQRETQNSTILSLWGSGFFLSGKEDEALTALKNMSFDGKEKLIQDIEERSVLQQQLMSMQQQIEQLSGQVNAYKSSAQSYTQSTVPLMPSSSDEFYNNIIDSVPAFGGDA